MMEELKPCPFCGGKAELICAPGYFKSGLSSSGWLVKCKNGCCNQMPYSSDHDAVEAWNRRAEPQWIPCNERLPEEAYPVIVTWRNDDPVSYYQYILGKHYVGVAHYKNGKWFWYSSITEDVLMEYGRCDSEEFDEAINVLAWMPLPEPYRGKGDDK